MDQTRIQSDAEDFVRRAKENRIQIEDAIAPEFAGIQIFDFPLIGYSLSGDPLYTKCLKPEVVGAHFILPSQWLSSAQTVISFFLPFTKAVRQSNVGGVWPSSLWLHGRIEGQKFLFLFAEHMASLLRTWGYETVIPTMEKTFREVVNGDVQSDFTSNWSERHVAYISGLGTFGLSKGLITEKGMAGRFISIITDAVFEPTKRHYTELYEYCTKCGICIRNCPVDAISFEHGKAHLPCAQYQSQCREKFSPRYGCGKCQIGVPCEFQNPSR
ncbi:MAG: 4Fe-4S binding protein [Fastidiosipilaceae bacterium]|jgi:epoxyqueuosine reductase